MSIRRLHRLIDSEEMGELFKVLAYTSPAWPQPEGFDVVQAQTG